MSKIKGAAQTVGLARRRGSLVGTARSTYTDGSVYGRTHENGTWALKPKTTETLHNPAQGKYTQEAGNYSRTTGGGLTRKGKAAAGAAGGVAVYGADKGRKKIKKNVGPSAFGIEH